MEPEDTIMRMLPGYTVRKGINKSQNYERIMRAVHRSLEDEWEENYSVRQILDEESEERRMLDEVSRASLIVVSGLAELAFKDDNDVDDREDLKWQCATLVWKELLQHLRVRMNVIMALIRESERNASPEMVCAIVEQIRAIWRLEDCLCAFEGLSTTTLVIE